MLHAAAAVLAFVSCLGCDAPHVAAHGLLLAGGSLCPTCAEDFDAHSARGRGEPEPHELGFDDGCEHCEDGLVERSEDRFEHREGHYEVTWQEACPHCARGAQRAADSE